MKRYLHSLLLAVIVVPFAQAEDKPFPRPDCSAYQHLIAPEATCISVARREVNMDLNASAIRNSGLEFRYMARPPSGEALDAYPAAKEALEDKVDGKFLITFSVNRQGDVEDVKVKEASSAAIDALALVWAETISKWKFVKLEKPIRDVPFHRLYLYPEETEADTLTDNS